MDSNTDNLISEHEIIVKHLRKSRELGKHVLTVSPEKGSAIISHKFVVTSFVDDRIELKTEIDFLPVIRLYKTGQNKIIDDEDLLNEDVE